MLILLFSLVEFTAVNSPLTDTLVSGQFYLCTRFNSPFSNKKKYGLVVFTGSKLSVFFFVLFFFFYINQSPT